MAVLAALVSAVFFGLNAVASKILFLPDGRENFDAISLFVARGFWTLPLFLILALATMPRPLDKVYPALFVVGVFGTIGSLLLIGMGLLLGRIDAVLIPLTHFDRVTILWFDLELVLLLSLGGQLLQGLALRTLNVALVVALTSYGSIAGSLAASTLLLGEHLTHGARNPTV